jgi:hypothetical protein
VHEGSLLEKYTGKVKYQFSYFMPIIIQQIPIESHDNDSDGQCRALTIPTIQMLVLLLTVIAAVSVMASRLKIPPAILLVITGVILAVIPGLPTVKPAPEFVLLIVLPPIIYSSAVAMSWREFKFNLRPISLLAVGCALFTTIAPAAVTHWLLGFSWPVGFVLGAIVSPPDAVAPLSIARRMQVPRRLVVILEGEGLANDARRRVPAPLPPSGVIRTRRFQISWSHKTR